MNGSVHPYTNRHTVKAPNTQSNDPLMLHFLGFAFPSNLLMNLDNMKSDIPYEKVCISHIFTHYIFLFHIFYTYSGIFVLSIAHTYIRKFVCLTGFLSNLTQDGWCGVKERRITIQLTEGIRSVFRSTVFQSQHSTVKYFCILAVKIHNFPLVPGQPWLTLLCYFYDSCVALWSLSSQYFMSNHLFIW